jgi:hypothetical protein
MATRVYDKCCADAVFTALLVDGNLLGRLVEPAYLSCIVEQAAVLLVGVQLLPDSRAVCTAIGTCFQSG